MVGLLHRQPGLRTCNGEMRIQGHRGYQLVQSSLSRGRPACTHNEVELRTLEKLKRNKMEIDNGKKVLILAGKAAPKVLREDKITELF